MIPQTADNFAEIEKLRRLTELFGASVNQSVRNCCCCVRWNDSLFARNDQARLILKRAFEGRQFFVEGAHGNTIDCMFFPCSANEEVQFENPSPDLHYLKKPTVIMCNPNALVYQ
jgi:hypothetical protein